MSEPAQLSDQLTTLIQTQQQLTQAINQQTSALMEMAAVNQEILSLLIQDTDLDPDRVLDDNDDLD